MGAPLQAVSLRYARPTDTPGKRSSLLLPPEERLIAQKPVPLSVSEIADRVVREEGTGCVVSIVAGSAGAAGPVAGGRAT